MHNFVCIWETNVCSFIWYKIYIEKRFWCYQKFSSKLYHFVINMDVKRFQKVWLWEASYILVAIQCTKYYTLYSLYPRLSNIYLWRLYKLLYPAHLHYVTGVLYPVPTQVLYPVPTQILYPVPRQILYPVPTQILYPVPTQILYPVPTQTL